MILTIWLTVLYLILPQYLHSDKDDKADSPKPLNFGRLLSRIKMEPQIELIPLAFVDSIRGLLFCLTPKILDNSTSWLLLVNLELVFGY